MFSSLLRMLPFVLVMAVPSPAGARELAVPDEALIAVELATVALIPDTNVPVVLLREPDSGDVIPIFIGHAEARAILLALRGVIPPRPMSHDLMHDLIGKLSGSLERVIVDDLRDGTYHGALEVRLGRGGELVRIDARPSDALALAVRSGAEIRVAPSVLQAGRGLVFEGLGRDQVVTVLGITVVEATRNLRDALGLPDDRGVIASSATGFAAYAGIEAGSLMLRVNDEVPDSPMAFLELVRKTPPGGEVSIVFWKGGKRHTVRLPSNAPSRAPREVPL